MSRRSPWAGLRHSGIPLQISDPAANQELPRGQGSSNTDEAKKLWKQALDIKPELGAGYFDGDRADQLALPDCRSRRSPPVRLRRLWHSAPDLQPCAANGENWHAVKIQGNTDEAGKLWKQASTSNRNSRATRADQGPSGIYSGVPRQNMQPRQTAKTGDAVKIQGNTDRARKLD